MVISMKKHSKVISVLLAVALVVSICTAPAAALSPDKDTGPETRAITVLPSMTFDDETLHMSVVVADSNAFIVAYVTLWCDGEIVGTWSKSGTSTVSFDDYVSVVSGNTYELVISGYTNGTTFRSVSMEKSCP